MKKSITPTTSKFKTSYSTDKLLQRQSEKLSETLPLLDKTYSTTALLINYFSLKTKFG